MVLVSNDINKYSLGKSYLKYFGKHTSLHGVRYVIDSNYHYSETVLWLISLVLAVCGSISLITTSWTRYEANPTVITLEKNFREWDYTFPALSVCYKDKLNKTIARNIIKKLWNRTPVDSDYGTHFSFLKSIANISFESVGSIAAFAELDQFKKISSEELVNLTMTVQENLVLHGAVEPETDKQYYMTINEMGVCYTFNGLVSNFITLDNIPHKSEKILTYSYFSPVHLNMNFLKPIYFFVHSPYDHPGFPDPAFEIPLSMVNTVTFESVEVISAADILSLDVGQRKCRFYNEPLTDDAVYSNMACKINCKKKLAIEYCGCIPYYFPSWGKAKMCNMTGLACIAPHAVNITKLIRSNGEKVNCKCEQMCEFLSISIEKSVVAGMVQPVGNYGNAQVAKIRLILNELNKIRHRRDIIFRFEDLLVSLGGTVALFLGSSVLSFVEVGYFWSLRFYFYVKNYRKNIPNE